MEGAGIVCLVWKSVEEIWRTVVVKKASGQTFEMAVAGLVAVWICSLVIFVSVQMSEELVLFPWMVIIYQWIPSERQLLWCNKL